MAKFKRGELVWINGRLHAVTDSPENDDLILVTDDLDADDVNWNSTNIRVINPRIDEVRAV